MFEKLTLKRDDGVFNRKEFVRAHSIMICKAPEESAYDIVVDAMNEKERSYS